MDVGVQVMKVITSIDEALEAERENRLVFLKECTCKKVGTTWCDQVFGAIKREALGLKHEEVKRTLTGVIDSE